MKRRRDPGGVLLWERVYGKTRSLTEERRQSRFKAVTTCFKICGQAVWKAVFIALFCESAARADASDVPFLQDGTVEVQKVMGSFSASIPLGIKSDFVSIDGFILGKSFSATYDRAAVTDPFILSIKSPELSGHATYFTSVLLIDIICLEVHLRPNEVNWREKSAKIADGWDVEVSCSHQAREQSS